MNRKERRKKEARARKRSSKAPIEERLVGKHAPVVPELKEELEKAMKDLIERFPTADIALFVGEHHAREGTERILPHFNYISNCDRADMTAMMEAFVWKNRDLLPELRIFDEAKPKGKPS